MRLLPFVSLVSRLSLSRRDAESMLCALQPPTTGAVSSLVQQIMSKEMLYEPMIELRDSVRNCRSSCVNSPSRFQCRAQYPPFLASEAASKLAAVRVM